MILRILFGLLALGALAGGGWAWLQRRKRGLSGEQNAVQWPFDATELRSLMDTVIAEQRERVRAIEDSAGRNRAKAFLDYYERRRQAIAS